MKSREQIERSNIDIEYEFTQSPAQVWRAISEPKLLAQWLLPNDIDSEVGRRFKLENFSGAIQCEVLASEPEHLLRYSWRTAENDGDLDTVVTFVLTETDAGGTHLRLIHSGFPQPAAQVRSLPQDKAATINSAANDSSYGVKLLWAA